MINDKYKLSDVAKDLGVDQKEIIDLLEKNFSGEKKRTTALTGSVIDIYSSNASNFLSYSEYLADLAPWFEERFGPKFAQCRERMARP